MARDREPKIDADYEDTKDSLHFDIDAGTEWFSPLARCFALGEKDVESAVRRVIRIEWQYGGKNNWREDERHTRKIFNDRETWDSRSDPSTHDLQFFLTYHAVMVVAGEWLATYPTHHDPEYPRSDFGHWLAEHSVSRSDGGWRADRRDPAPLERPCWKDEKSDVDWRWSVQRNDFDRVLISPNQRVNVWGDWDAVKEERKESIAVRSALVSPERSEALLRALQSAGAFGYGFPRAGEEDYEIESGGFRFKGWVAKSKVANGLDERDPWAGNIAYPPHVPAQFVVDLMGINSDSEHRQWAMQEELGGRTALWSQVWGEYREREGEEGTESGRRLQASLAFIAEFLQKTRMDLIVKVQIQRRRSRYRNGENDEFAGNEFPDPGTPPGTPKVITRVWCADDGTYSRYVGIAPSKFRLARQSLATLAGSQSSPAPCRFPDGASPRRLRSACMSCL